MGTMRLLDAATKVTVVLEGLAGRPVAEICREYGVCRDDFYLWRRHLLANICSLFEFDNRSICSPETLEHGPQSSADHHLHFIHEERQHV